MLPNPILLATIVWPIVMAQTWFCQINNQAQVQYINYTPDLAHVCWLKSGSWIQTSSISCPNSGHHTWTRPHMMLSAIWDDTWAWLWTAFYFKCMKTVHTIFVTCTGIFFLGVWCYTFILEEEVKYTKPGTLKIQQKQNTKLFTWLDEQKILSEKWHVANLFYIPFMS